MTKNEVEISKLPGPPQIGDTSTHEKCVLWSTAPTLDKLPGRFVLWGKTGFDQTVRHPGTAHLVFFTKLAARSRSDEDDGIVLCQPFCCRDVVAKAGKIRGIAMPDLAHQTGACGREQDQWPRDV